MKIHLHRYSSQLCINHRPSSHPCANNLSVAVAFYALLSFFHGTQKDLEWCNPWPKFLCIKGVVFMTFWQGVCIQGMGSMGMVDEKSALQVGIDIIVCNLIYLPLYPNITMQHYSIRTSSILTSHSAVPPPPQTTTTTMMTMTMMMTDPKSAHLHRNDDC